MTVALVSLGALTFSALASDVLVMERVTGQQALDLSLRAPAAALTAADTAPRPNALARSIAAAARKDLIRSGVESSFEAVRECVRDDERSGGLGPLSTEFGRPISNTNHCRRY
ncbi:hypothetical protein [Ideonella sp. BN130291]|uniref:hypothetical protein n=1 Tax=Ideonella sp. BN130291 TaxID=3112940 RepID=UPI002E264AB2|nr:hypothetical protein [Ideonella sp. BN130291]